jgi:beta-lactamase regulating signal transducer with metallopeptidase domain
MNYFWNSLTSHGSFEFLALLALTAAKATLLLAFAYLLNFAFRRFSAATRHLLWTSALCASLVLPFMSFIQVWEVPILPAQISALGNSGGKGSIANVAALEVPEARVPRDLAVSSEASDVLRAKPESQTGAVFLAETSTALDAPEPESPRQQKATALWPRVVNWTLAVWLAGVLLFLFKLLTGFAATNLLTRRAVEFADPSLTGLFSSLLLEVNLKSKVRLLRSERTSMPVVYGIWRPAVLLPAEAEGWSEERQRMVLLHELTHVTRRDCLTQLLAQVACAFYWFNPFVWFAARRLRVEREQACDDFVLSIGTKPSDYANHLLEIARSMQERSIFKWSQTTSVAMARRSQLEGRLLAILSKENKRGAVSRAAAMSLVALTCVLLLSVAAVRPIVIHAQNPGASASASSVEKAKLEKDSTDTSVAAGAARGVETVVRVAATREADGELEETTAAAVGSPLALSLNDVQMEQEAGRNLKGEVERIVEHEVVQDAAPQAANVVQVPEVKLSTKGEANPFISAGYRQDRQTQTQGRSGDFIDEMASVGYTNLSLDELISLKTAGVNADYVRSLRALGFASLTWKELTALSIHGVTQAYIQSIRAAGYSELSAKELTTFRIHGITPEYIKTLRDAGYGNLSAKQLVEFAVYGVTPAFISGIRAAGNSNLSPKEISSFRIYGITPEFIRKARSRLGDLTVKQLISLKNIGILDDEKGKEKEKEKEKN